MKQIIYSRIEWTMYCGLASLSSSPQVWLWYCNLFGCFHAEARKRSKLASTWNQQTQSFSLWLAEWSADETSVLWMKQKHCVSMARPKKNELTNEFNRITSAVEPVNNEKTISESSHWRCTGQEGRNSAQRSETLKVCTWCLWMLKTEKRKRNTKRDTCTNDHEVLEPNCSHHGLEWIEPDQRAFYE